MVKIEEPSLSLVMAVVEEASFELLLQGEGHATVEDENWYLDTRASSHMIKRCHFFRDLVESQGGYVKFGENSRLEIFGKGEIEIKCQDG